MKRYVISICILALSVMLFSTSALAHTRNGTVVLQGAINFSSSNGDLYGDENRTQLMFSPAVHYFVINQLAIGGKLGVETVSQGDFNSSSFLVGPSIQYYFGVDQRTIPYIGGAVLFRSIASENRVGNMTVKADETGSSIGLSVGLAHFFRDHLAITPELSVNLESLGDNTGTTFMLGVGLAGFLY